MYYIDRTCIAALVLARDGLRPGLAWLTLDDMTFLLYFLRFWELCICTISIAPAYHRALMP